MKRALQAAALAGVVAASVLLVPGESAVAVEGAKRFENCTALNAKYPHGVGRPKARDKTRSGTNPVTTFKRSKKLYRANKHSDRDRDGVACEKH